MVKYVFRTLLIFWLIWLISMIGAMGLSVFDVEPAKNYLRFYQKN